MNIKEIFLHFWKSDNEKISIVRDVVVALLAVFVVLLILWAYTGQWFAAPMVAIESGSMEHEPPRYPDPPFGRFGTIDAGDMVLVQIVNKRADVISHGVAQTNNDPIYYNDWGDVVIYHPDGDMEATQIIHRAMCWVEVTELASGIPTYTIEEYGVVNQTVINLVEIGLSNVPSHRNYNPSWSHSGFITKGDNNDVADQVGGIAREPVKAEWISGKARSEIPWLGTINLFFEDLLHGKGTVGNVHEDSLICLGILISILISIPISFDVYDYFKGRKKKQQF